jgi:hypothetical protein
MRTLFSSPLLCRLAFATLLIACAIFANSEVS